MPGPLFIKKYNVTNTVTTAQLAFIVSNNNLVVGQIYVVSDSAVVALAITNNTYKDIAVLGAGGGGGAVWGDITGTLSSQTDLNSVLGDKQPLDADLTALSSLFGVDKIFYRDAPGSWSQVTIGTNLDFTGGVLSATGGSSGGASPILSWAI
jgi:hypothetical protein